MGIVVFILQRRKLKAGEEKCLTPNLAGSKWQEQKPNSHLPLSKLLSFHYALLFVYNGKYLKTN